MFHLINNLFKKMLIFYKQLIIFFLKYGNSSYLLFRDLIKSFISKFFEFCDVIKDDIQHSQHYKNIVIMFKFFKKLVKIIFNKSIALKNYISKWFNNRWIDLENFLSIPNSLLEFILCLDWLYIINYFFDSLLPVLQQNFLIKILFICSLIFSFIIIIRFLLHNRFFKFFEKHILIFLFFFLIIKLNIDLELIFKLLYYIILSYSDSIFIFFLSHFQLLIFFFTSFVTYFLLILIGKVWNKIYQFYLNYYTLIIFIFLLIIL